MRSVATIGGYGSCLIAGKNTTYRGIGEWREAMLNLGRVPNWGHTGHGSIHHIQGQAILDSLGITANAVPYEGGANTRHAAIIGEVDFAVLGSQNIAGYETELNTIALMADERSAFFPDLATTVEQGVDVPLFFTPIMIHVAKDTPDEIVAFLESAIAQAVQADAYVQLTRNSTLDVIFRSAEESHKWIVDASENWGKVISNIRSS